ncbi:cell wall-binding protein [Clostridium taeniosporum]|uniref:Cell wall-binding protein n=1 Tax=Clostridium taeniosporum TaxID=394958 RepID=A0A1D7XJ13_9CLOT|nr:cell wall-binding protein [Clostridium taeniosporum]AOR23322.1 cell wall-binding protein [Clostridium taeniosporum]
MKKNLIVIGTVALMTICNGSVQAFAYDNNANTKIEISQEEKFEPERNWLNMEVADELNKNFNELTKEDFLKIKKLDLHYKMLEGELPETIGLMKNLEYLNLNYCKLTKIPDNITELNKLTYIDLGDNKFRELPEKFEEKIIKGEYQYVDVESDELRLKEGWHFLKGKWTYLDRYGDRVKETTKIDGKTYNFNEDGTVKIGWQKEEDKWFYYDTSGQLIKNTWKVINNKKYYFNEKGEVQTGFLDLDSKRYYLNPNGDMATGLVKIDKKSYYFDSNGVMLKGWLNEGDKRYYFDENGVMVAGRDMTIDGKNYKFYSNGVLVKNQWLNDNTYIQPNGEIVNVSNNYAHSNVQLNAFKYMTNPSNQLSVYDKAVELHGGDTSNNCVYFLSEVLRRNGVWLPEQTCNTYELEGLLKEKGFVASNDFTQLKPGDILYTNGHSHVYVFMGWRDNQYAYIVDNQREKFDNEIYHIRNVYYDDSIHSTDRAIYFYYYPY